MEQTKSRKNLKSLTTVEYEGKGRVHGEEGMDEKHNATAETWYDSL